MRRCLVLADCVVLLADLVVGGRFVVVVDVVIT
jgi:hypothetical protein